MNSPLTFDPSKHVPVIPGSVLGIGNALVDIIIKIDDDNILSNLNLRKGSMTLVDQNKSQELLSKTIQFNRQITSGGAVANTITGLASLGVHTGYIGKIGNDEEGKIFSRNMREKNINFMELLSSTPTGKAVALISEDGERTFGTFLGASIEMSPGDIKDEYFTGYEWFMAEGYLVQDHNLIEHAMRSAKRLGCRIAMDMASYNVVENNRDFLRYLVMEYVDLLFANEAEAYAFAGTVEPLHALGNMGELCSIAVLKVGKDGSWIRQEEKVFKVDSLKARSIDTTGAGDLYAAGFLYGLSKNFDLQKCGQIGSILGGNVIEVLGAKIPEKRWPEIRKIIDNLS